MRLQSPSRASQSYLDPPAVALRRADSTRRASAVPRASSAILPSSSGSRATLSPRRPLPIARTMSIDPPHLLPIRRDSSFNFALPSSTEPDFDMVVDSFGDSSRPPSPRPSFRMRSSMTPQPQQPPQRYISEPPPLNSLISKPIFLHPPAQAHEPSPLPTLGSLADSVRTVSKIFCA
jgi:nucleoporin NUP1